MENQFNIKIMVVDDEVDLEPLIRQKFRRQIRNDELDFVFAHNGLEALSKLIEYPNIGIILSDINMPEMDGLTLLLKLKELKKPSLKTVIVSAYGDMENIRTAMNRGAFDFLTKPINFEDLEITINKTLDEIGLQHMAMKEHDQLISIQQDLSVARDIQQGILPKTFPPFPGRTDLEIFASMTAAKEVGGDFYDFFMIDNDRLGFVIGDVSGKGIPAAIFMAVSRTLIRATGLNGASPGECLQYVNNLLCNESVSCMFVTVFYGIMNMKTGELEYANAGHNPPYILRDGSMTVEELKSTGDIILGCFEGHEFASMKIQLNPKDGILLFTDGVTEAFNRKDEIYGEERLVNLLTTLQSLSTSKIVNSIVDDVNLFSQGMAQSDDITLLSLKYFG
ncbi:MAG: fused response regulator/phosphatase [Bacteroidales bacterium]|nr:fused response regulator/phosphatase [Bacteroidales bacterium]